MAKRTRGEWWFGTIMFSLLVIAVMGMPIGVAFNWWWLELAWIPVIIVGSFMGEE